MKRYAFFLLPMLFLATAISVSAQHTASIKEQDTSFEAPDFNYPKTVINNANVALENAFVKGNNEDVVLAVIQTSLAQSFISSDSLPEIIDEIEHVVAKENNECIKSTLLLLGPLDVFIPNAFNVALPATPSTASPFFD